MNFQSSSTIIPEISERQHKLLKELAANTLMIGRPLLFIMEHNEEDSPKERADFIKRVEDCEYLETIELLKEVCEDKDITNTLSMMAEKLKRNIRAFTITPYTLGILIAEAVEVEDPETKEKRKVVN